MSQWRAYVFIYPFVPRQRLRINQRFLHLGKLKQLQNQNAMFWHGQTGGTPRKQLNFFQTFHWLSLECCQPVKDVFGDVMILR